MKKIRTLTVIGTRPEATKLVPLVLAQTADPRIECKVLVSAQHRQLLDQVLALFGIKPDHDFDIMTEGQTLTDVTARVLRGFKPVFEKEKPDVLLVQGDTATTFASALAAFYAGVRVGHVEAGLRTHDKHRPYPEEMNRRLVAALADYHFAPTELSRRNLLKENVPEKDIFVTGNTAIDMLKHTRRETFNHAQLNGLDFSKRLVIVTAHRRENWGGPMEEICGAVQRLAERFPDALVVWPVHPGKAVKDTVERRLAGRERIALVPPLDVFDMHGLMRRAALCLTDSGGLQEEAPSFDLPVVVLRDVTERPEGVECGALALGGTRADSIFAQAERLLADEEAHRKMAAAKNPYGDGNACERIVDAICLG